MKEIKLKQLTLQNFQGRSFVLDADGADVAVFAANNVGKTRLMSAFTWLLFDKDSMGRSDFEIKNLDSTGQYEHMLEHSVEAVLMIDAADVTIKKVYYEKWTRKRGSAEQTFGGHTTDHYIDGVPAQKKDFTGKVKEIAGDESVFRLLTSPHAFPSLHWQKQRDSLMGMCEDVTDADVIDTSKDLAELPDILGNKKLEDYRKVIVARRSEINKDLEKIPVRISENQQSLPDVTGLNLKGLQTDIERVDAELNAKKLELQGVNTGGKIAELSRKLEIAKADLRKFESSWHDAKMKEARKVSDEIKKIESEMLDAKNNVYNFNTSIDTKQRRINDIETQLVALREQWQDTDNSAFQDTVEQVCASCGQDLPAEKVQAARDKAIAKFNSEKAEELKRITSKGNYLSEEKAELEGDVRSLLERIDKIQSPVDADLDGLKEKRDRLEKEAGEYTMDTEHDSLSTAVKELEGAMQNEKDGIVGDITDLKDVIAGLDGDLNGLKSQADKFRQREKGEKRIEELKAQEKALAKEYERLERELYLMEQFTRTKCNILSERINGMFEFVRFKLFDELVNGGIEECCVMTVDGVPYGAGLGNSASIKAGLDVVRELQRYYGLFVPVFIDNRESCTLIPNMPGQIISLYVSPEDKTMRTEQTFKMEV